MTGELVERFARNAEVAGFVVHRRDVPDLPSSGVSEASYGLADTGSVVLAASREEPRARSLLPDVHVSLLRESRILPGLAELFERVGDDLPSALAIVSGPSRSADIEQRLTIGVHGPGEVHVVLLPDDREAVEEPGAARPQ
ncbi:MAG: LUD domain-containing protein [Actinomycetota bacterium]|nr:LUD domain-containing protein [Actinomycetota bacterium]